MDPPSNSNSLWQQPPEEAMDTKRDVNVALPNVQREPEVEEMEVNDASGVTEGNIEYLHPVEPLPSRQTLCHRVQVPRTLSPQIRGKSHEYSGTYEQR